MSGGAVAPRRPSSAHSSGLASPGAVQLRVPRWKAAIRIHQLQQAVPYGCPVALTRAGLVPRRTSEEAAATSLGRFVRSESWNGLQPGDVVRVAGQSRRGRHWRFKAHVTNTGNGASWVEVLLVEGPVPSRRPGEDDADGVAPRAERVRSFAPELVSPRWQRRGRRRPDPGDEPTLF